MKKVKEKLVIEVKKKGKESYKRDLTLFFLRGGGNHLILVRH